MQHLVELGVESVDRKLLLDEVLELQRPKKWAYGDGRRNGPIEEADGDAEAAESARRKVSMRKTIRNVLSLDIAFTHASLCV